MIIDKIKNKINKFSFIPFVLDDNKWLSRKTISYNSENSSWWLKYDNFKDGVPFTDYGEKGMHVNPTFVAYYGFQCLEHYKSTKEKRWLEYFKIQSDWFVEHSKSDSIRGVYWTTDFDWSTGKAECKAPFIDCMTQSVAISTLVLAYKIFDDIHYIEIAQNALKVYDIDYKEGGIKSIDENDNIYYEEYPSDPLPRVFDGFLISLLGPLDIYLATGDTEAKRIFDNGIKTLNQVTYEYLFFDFWFYFGGKNYHELSDGVYHAYTVALLEVLATYTNSDKLKKIVDKSKKRSKKSYWRLLAMISSTIIAHYNKFKDK